MSEGTWTWLTEIKPLIENFCASRNTSMQHWPALKKHMEENGILKENIRYAIIKYLTDEKGIKKHTAQQWIPDELKDPKKVEYGKKMQAMKKNIVKKVPVIIDEDGAIKYAEGRGETKVVLTPTVEEVQKEYDDMVVVGTELQAGGMPLTIIHPEDTQVLQPKTNKFVIKPNDDKLINSLANAIWEATGKKAPDVQLDKGDVFKGIVIEYELPDIVKEIYALWGPSTTT